MVATKAACSIISPHYVSSECKCISHHRGNKHQGANIIFDRKTIDSIFLLKILWKEYKKSLTSKNKAVYLNCTQMNTFFPLVLWISASSPLIFVTCPSIQANSGSSDQT
jgi:hypothetical protein